MTPSHLQGQPAPCADGEQGAPDSPLGPTINCTWWPLADSPGEPATAFHVLGHSWLGWPHL